MAFLCLVLFLNSCKPKNAGNAVSGDASKRTYVPPGKYDELYNFVSGGFSGQVSVYGFPSGRLLRVIPVFSVDPERGWGYSEETKPMLNTSHGQFPGMISITLTCHKPMVKLTGAGYLQMPIIHPVLRALILKLFALQKLLKYPTVQEITLLLS